ncbi:MAG: DUF3105 domain-containing protein [Actinomycetota bacterium]|nr:DUF3105 domain-containing protein [Actinomycetota bacterium]
MSRPKPWGFIAGALALVLFIGGLLTYAVLNAGTESPRGEQDRVRTALEEEGGVQAVADLPRNHVEGPVNYPQTPPVGGDHNGVWQSCQGTVYTERIASEHAVHSMEHGAVWVTYRPDLPAAQVDTLARRVQGLDYTLMSPFPDLPSPVVLSAWGKQLAVDRADDPRVEQFIQAYRIQASQEPGATCSSPLTVQGVDAPLTQEQLAEVTGS